MAYVFSPVRAEPEILRETIPDWYAMRGVKDIYVYDDNVNPESTELLKKLKVKFLPKIDLPGDEHYRVGEDTHHWSNQAVARVTVIKNYALEHFSEQEVLFIDADIAPPPGMLEQLQAMRSRLSTSPAIISEVFWTKWAPDQPYLPNVWDQHSYSFEGGAPRVIEFADRGDVFRVGGLGACTLMRAPTHPSFHFGPVPGLPPWWEDRQFCVRASALGFTLLADTTCPPFHIYRPSMIEECRAWKAAGRTREWFLKNWLNDDWKAQLYGEKRNG